MGINCYYEGCDKTPKWHIFVDPGTYACDEHAPGDTNNVVRCTKCGLIWDKETDSEFTGT